jgi:hypothetical protein
MDGKIQQRLRGASLICLKNRASSNHSVHAMMCNSLLERRHVVVVKFGTSQVILFFLPWKDFDMSRHFYMMHMYLLFCFMSF